MEELRSLEVLDQEIRTDSMKKAEKILSDAQQMALDIENSLSDRLQKAMEDAKKASDHIVSDYRENINASIPLEKQRYLVSYIDGEIRKAIDSYVLSMKTEVKHELLKNLVARIKPVVGERKFVYETVGSLDLSDADRIVGNVFDSGCFSGKKGYCRAENSLSYGIIVRTDDSKIICRLTLEEKVNEILHENRESLALALFGGRLPE